MEQTEAHAHFRVSTLPASCPLAWPSLAQSAPARLALEPLSLQPTAVKHLSQTMVTPRAEPQPDKQPAALETLMRLRHACALALLALPSTVMKQVSLTMVELRAESQCDKQPAPLETLMRLPQACVKQVCLTMVGLRAESHRDKQTAALNKLMLLPNS